MTNEQTALVERIRNLLAEKSVVREVSMFGVRAFMVNEKMIAGAAKHGELLVRVDPERHDELLKRTGAAQAVMGPRRDMGPGWIMVDARALAAEDDLTQWVEVAMEYNRTVTSDLA